MPLLKWKPASDITAFRRQEANNELYIADQRENNASNKKHRRTLVSSPPTYAGNGVWEDLKQLWGYYVTQPVLAPAAIAALSDITFFVVYSTATLYTNATGTAIYTDVGLNTLLTNANIIPAATYAAIKQGLTGVGTVPAGSTRQNIVNTLNSVLSGITFNVGATSSKLVASVDSTGYLTISLNGGSLPAAGTHTPPYFVGLFFGDSPNGSTSLGATKLNGTTGVTGSALVIREGSTSVTAPYIIGDPAIFT